MMRRHVSGVGPGADRRAIQAVAVTFLVNGIVFSSLLPRYPQIVAQAGADEATFGLGLTGAGLGGLVGGMGAPILARAVGLVRATWTMGLFTAAAAVAVALSPSVLALTVAFVVAGAADAAHDISMNEVALGEQIRRGRSIMGRLHGTWSLGSTVAAAVGAGMAGLGVDVGLHLAAVAVVAVGIQLWAAGRLRGRETLGEDGRGGHADPAPPAPSLRPTSPRPVSVRLGRWPVLAGVVIATIGAVLIEQTPLDWSALMLSRDLDAGPGLAGSGPVLFSAGILAGRAITDPAVDALGASRVLRVSNAAAAVAMATGLAVAAVTDAAWPALVGLTIAGAGVATNFPLLFGAGDVVARRLGLPAGTGTSIIGTLPRVAGLALPAIIGWMAQSVGLVPAVGLSALGAIAVAGLLPAVVRGDR